MRTPSRPSSGADKATPERPSFGGPPPSSAPHAEFRQVPPAKQAAVALAVSESVTHELSPTGRPLSPALAELVAHIGSADFYDVLARLDSSSSKQWKAMGKVQRQFAAAEPGFDPKTRAYSESMRLTLHAAVIQHFANAALRGSMTLYERFLELHPTAFYQNGGWFGNLQIPLEGAWHIIEATPLEMSLHSLSLLRGAVVDDAATRRAADWVRKARASVL